MEILEKINADFKEALKARDEARIDVIRLIKTAVKNREIEKGSSIDEKDLNVILSRLLKQHKEAIDFYTKGNRSDLVEKEKRELDVIKSYLPEQMTEEEILSILKEAIFQLGATSLSDLGKVMGKVMPELKGKADGKLVQNLARKLLSS